MCFSFAHSPRTWNGTPRLPAHELGQSVKFSQAKATESSPNEGLPVQRSIHILPSLLLDRLLPTKLHSE